jgi:hypothetical protein
MSSVDPSAGASDDAQALAVLGDALDRLGAGSARHLVEVAILVRAFPRWAVWVPASSGMWTAVRPAGSIPPGPEAPMVWVRAGTAGELTALMRTADDRVALRRELATMATWQRREASGSGARRAASPRCLALPGHGSVGAHPVPRRPRQLAARTPQEVMDEYWE